MQATVTATAPDWHHVERTASVVVYTGNTSGPSFRQQGMSVNMGWGGGSRVFTGMTVNVETNKVVGKETITYKGTDYMKILKDSPIVASPTYDGMYMVGALYDLSRRAGIRNPIMEFGDDENFFFRAGNTFRQPKVKFKPSQTIFDCMMWMLKQTNSYMFFDEFGNLHFADVPGGIMTPTGGSSGANFVTSATSPNAILDQKNAGVDFNDTISMIRIRTVQRDMDNTFVVYTKDSGSDSAILYKKVFLNDEAAIGSYQAAVALAEKYAATMFKPFRKASVKSAGDPSVDVLHNFSIDGQSYVCMNATKTFNAQDNSITCEFTGKAYG